MEKSTEKWGGGTETEKGFNRLAVDILARK
jgi:hypothetical protein